MKEEFPLVAGPKVTKLVTTYDPAHDNVIVVESIDSIPKPPNHITIFDLNEHYTTVSYDFVGNNKLTGLKVIEGEQSHIYSIGDYVVRTIDKYDFEAIIDHIKYLETHKLDKYQGKCKSGKIMAVDEDGFIKPTEATDIGCKWGAITGNIDSQTDLKEKLDEKIDIDQGISARGRVLKADDYGKMNLSYIKWGEIVGGISQQPDLVTEFNKKLDNSYAVTEDGKIFRIDEDGKVKLVKYSYKTIEDKPTINGVGVWGDKTSSDYKVLGINSEITTNEEAYCKKPDGTQEMLDVTTDNISNTIVKRGSNGEIKVNITPSLDTDAVSKNYADTKVDKYQGTIYAGKVFAVDSNGFQTLVDGGGLTSDYNALDNKPSISGVTLIGNKTPAEIGVVKSTGWSPNKQLGTNSSGEVVEVSSSTVSFSDIQGEPTDNTKLNLILNSKVGYAPASVSTASVSFTVGKDDTGFFLYEE